MQNVTDPFLRCGWNTMHSLKEHITVSLKVLLSTHWHHKKLQKIWSKEVERRSYDCWPPPAKIPSPAFRGEAVTTSLKLIQHSHSLGENLKVTRIFLHEYIPRSFFGWVGRFGGFLGGTLLLGLFSPTRTGVFIWLENSALFREDKKWLPCCSLGRLFIRCTFCLQRNRCVCTSILNYSTLICYYGLISCSLLIKLKKNKPPHVLVKSLGR